jgi:DNA repair protein RecO (recombination protein O)
MVIQLAAVGRAVVLVEAADPAAVAESFLLKLLSMSGFHPALTTCAVCGAPAPQRFASSLGGAVCDADADLDAGPASLEALDFLATLGGTGLLEAGDVQADTRVRRESRSLLFGFTEYHLERRMKSLPILARSLTT